MTIMLEEETDKQKEFDFEYRSLIENVVKTALESEGFPDQVQISVTLTDEEHIKEINKNFRNIDSPTDVLSFPMLEFDGDGYGYEHVDSNSVDYDIDTDELLMGDIVLCIHRVFSQAEEYGHSTQREFAFLLVHSMLHLSGYDHIDENDTLVMEDRQRQIMNTLGISRS